MDDYLIWSNKRRMWRGRRRNRVHAAHRACRHLQPRRGHADLPRPDAKAQGHCALTEIPVLLADMEEMLRVARGRHADFDPEPLEDHP